MPNVYAKSNITNNVIESPILTVKAFTVRFLSPVSLTKNIRLENNDTKIASIRASIRIFNNIRYTP